MLHPQWWQSDTSATVCTECTCRFSWLTRRHHCRHCGLVFCARCSAHRLWLSPIEAPATPGIAMTLNEPCSARVTDVFSVLHSSASAPASHTRSPSGAVRRRCSSSSSSSSHASSHITPRLGSTGNMLTGAGSKTSDLCNDFCPLFGLPSSLLPLLLPITASKSNTDSDAQGSKHDGMSSCVTDDTASTRTISHLVLRCSETQNSHVAKQTEKLSACALAGPTPGAVPTAPGTHSHWMCSACHMPETHSTGWAKTQQTGATNITQIADKMAHITSSVTSTPAAGVTSAVVPRSCMTTAHSTDCTSPQPSQRLSSVADAAYAQGWSSAIRFAPRKIHDGQTYFLCRVCNKCQEDLCRHGSVGAPLSPRHQVLQWPAEKDTKPENNTDIVDTSSSTKTAEHTVTPRCAKCPCRADCSGEHFFARAWQAAAEYEELSGLAQRRHRVCMVVIDERRSRGLPGGLSAPPNQPYAEQHTHGRRNGTRMKCTTQNAEHWCTAADVAVSSSGCIDHRCEKGGGASAAECKHQPRQHDCVAKQLPASPSHASHDTSQTRATSCSIQQDKQIHVHLMCEEHLFGASSHAGGNPTWGEGQTDREDTIRNAAVTTSAQNTADTATMSQKDFICACCTNDAPEQTSTRCYAYQCSDVVCEGCLFNSVLPAGMDRTRVGQTHLIDALLRAMQRVSVGEQTTNESNSPVAHKDSAPHAKRRQLVLLSLGLPVTMLPMNTTTQTALAAKRALSVYPSTRSFCSAPASCFSVSTSCCISPSSALLHVGQARAVERHHVQAETRERSHTLRIRHDGKEQTRGLEQRHRLAARSRGKAHKSPSKRRSTCLAASDEDHDESACAAHSVVQRMADVACLRSGSSENLTMRPWRPAWAAALVLWRYLASARLSDNARMDGDVATRPAVSACDSSTVRVSQVGSDDGATPRLIGSVKTGTRTRATDATPADTGRTCEVGAHSTRETASMTITMRTAPSFSATATLPTRQRCTRPTPFTARATSDTHAAIATAVPQRCIAALVGLCAVYKPRSSLHSKPPTCAKWPSSHHGRHTSCLNSGFVYSGITCTGNSMLSDNHAAVMCSRRHVGSCTNTSRLGKPHGIRCRSGTTGSSNPYSGCPYLYHPYRFSLSLHTHRGMRDFGVPRDAPAAPPSLSTEAAVALSPQPQHHAVSSAAAAAALDRLHHTCHRVSLCRHHYHHSCLCDACGEPDRGGWCTHDEPCREDAERENSRHESEVQKLCRRLTRESTSTDGYMFVILRDTRAPALHEMNAADVCHHTRKEVAATFHEGTNDYSRSQPRCSRRGNDPSRCSCSAARSCTSKTDCCHNANRLVCAQCATSHSCSLVSAAKHSSPPALTLASAQSRFVCDEAAVHDAPFNEKDLRVLVNHIDACGGQRPPIALIDVCSRPMHCGRGDGMPCNCVDPSLDSSPQTCGCAALPAAAFHSSEAEAYALMDRFCCGNCSADSSCTTISGNRVCTGASHAQLTRVSANTFDSIPWMSEVEQTFGLRPRRPMSLFTTMRKVRQVARRRNIIYTRAYYNDASCLCNAQDSRHAACQSLRTNSTMCDTGRASRRRADVATCAAEESDTMKGCAGYTDRVDVYCEHEPTKEGSKPRVVNNTSPAPVSREDELSISLLLRCLKTVTACIIEHDRSLVKQ